MARLGVLTNFVSHTVVVGFTAGAAILIATSQIKHVMGVTLPQGEGFLNTWKEIILAVPDTNLYVLGIGLGTLLVAILLRRISKKIPHLLISMIVGSVAAILLGGADRGIKFVQEIPAKLPSFNMPELTVHNFRILASNAFAVALLGLIEAVAIARAIGTKTHQRIDGNQEFIGQGLSNIAGAFFSAYPSSGSFNRSGVNYEAGARTPLAAVAAALFLGGMSARLRTLGLRRALAIVGLVVFLGAAAWIATFPVSVSV